LIDDYLDNELSPRERKQLDSHLASCPRCADELRHRSALDHSVRQALGASVQHQYLPAEAGARFVQAAQYRFRRDIWRHRAGSVGQILVGLLAAVLVVVGLSAAVGRLSLPPELNRVILYPVKKLVLSGQRLVSVSPDAESDPGELQPAVPSLTTQPALSLNSSGTFVDPEPLHPGEPFTITLLLHNNLPEPLKSAQFDLEISGPTGYFRFPLSVSGPLPARGISLVRVTTDVLAGPCQDKYMISPTSIFRTPGAYKLRFTLFSPGTDRGR
jgi:hypothetical protein